MQDVCVTPPVAAVSHACKPLQPVASDTSMPATSTSCPSNITPGSTAARHLSPLSAGVVNGPEAKPSPFDRAAAVLVRAGRLDQHRTSRDGPVPLADGNASASLIEQPSMVIMGSLMERWALQGCLAPHADAHAVVSMSTKCTATARASTTQLRVVLAATLWPPKRAWRKSGMRQALSCVAKYGLGALGSWPRA